MLHTIPLIECCCQIIASPEFPFYVTVKICRAYFTLLPWKYTLVYGLKVWSILTIGDQQRHNDMIWHSGFARKVSQLLCSDGTLGCTGLLCLLGWAPVLNVQSYRVMTLLQPLTQDERHWFERRRLVYLDEVVKAAAFVPSTPNRHAVPSVVCGGPYPCCLWVFLWVVLGLEAPCVPRRRAGPDYWTVVYT